MYKELVFVCLLVSGCSTLQQRVPAGESSNLSSEMKIDRGPKRLMEDCKYVSFNNALLAAYRDKGPLTRLALSRKSQDLTKSSNDIVVFDAFDENNNLIGQYGYEVELTDPENGYCELGKPSKDPFRDVSKSIRRLGSQELLALKVQEDARGDESDIAKTSTAYWNECNTLAVNTALSLWYSDQSLEYNGRSPHFSFSSTRQKLAQGERVYQIGIELGNNEPIFSNPVAGGSHSDLNQFSKGRAFKLVVKQATDLSCHVVNSSVVSN